MDLNLADIVGPRRWSLYQDIRKAWLSAEPDDREWIDGIGGGDGVRLLRPGFSGRDVTVRFEDLEALAEAGLIQLQMTGKLRDCRLVPIR